MEKCRQDSQALARKLMRERESLESPVHLVRISPRVVIFRRKKDLKKIDRSGKSSLKLADRIIRPGLAKKARGRPRQANVRAHPVKQVNR